MKADPGSHGVKCLMNPSLVKMGHSNQVGRGQCSVRSLGRTNTTMTRTSPRSWLWKVGH